MEGVWVAVLALLADVGTKVLAARFLGTGSIRLGNLIELRCLHNTGMALGLLAGRAWASLLLPVLVMLGAGCLMRKYRTTRFTRACWALIAGGFAGNYGQRLLQGYVLDMIFFPWLPWFVCNVADICICFGVALLAYSLLMRPQDWEERRRADHEPN